MTITSVTWAAPPTSPVTQNGLKDALAGPGPKRWTPSTGQLIDVAKWNLLRDLPVKMRGAEDDKAETAQSFASL